MCIGHRSRRFLPGDFYLLSFRSLPERMRRRERNPEDVCRMNADARHFRENACANILRCERPKKRGTSRLPPGSWSIVPIRCSVLRVTPYAVLQDSVPYKPASGLANCPIVAYPRRIERSGESWALLHEEWAGPPILTVKIPAPRRPLCRAFGVLDSE